MVKLGRTFVYVVSNDGAGRVKVNEFDSYFAAMAYAYGLRALLDPALVHVVWEAQ